MARAMGSAGVSVYLSVGLLAFLRGNRKRSRGNKSPGKINRTGPTKGADTAKMRILRSPCDTKQRSEPNRGEVWRLRHTGVGTATPLTRNSVASKWKYNGDEITAEEEDNDDTDDNTDNNAAATDEESNTAPPVDDANAAAVAQQIQCKRAELAQFTTEAKALQAKRDKITKRLNQARQYVSRLKEKLSAWRSERKKKNGIESKMDKVLKE
eukprot:scaffold16320_cov131-Skeletonema_dohrnii-CCMP3373.AAC.1